MRKHWHSAAADFQMKKCPMWHNWWPLLCFAFYCLVTEKCSYQCILIFVIQIPELSIHIQRHVTDKMTFHTCDRELFKYADWLWMSSLFVGCFESTCLWITSSLMSPSHTLLIVLLSNNHVLLSLPPLSLASCHTQEKARGNICPEGDQCSPEKPD